jgi:dCTP deaminase
MILSDVDLKKSLDAGEITIDPLFPHALQPASIDLHLGSEFLFFKTDSTVCIDPREPLDDLMESVSIDDTRQFILHPGQFALGMTYETVGVPSTMVGQLEGKSSLGRIGLIVHATAGYIDPGNRLKITLELYNIANLPIKLYYRMPVAQISFTPLLTPTSTPYGKKELGSKYYGDMRPQASKYYQNFLKNNEWMTFQDKGVK